MHVEEMCSRLLKSLYQWYQFTAPPTALAPRLKHRSVLLSHRTPPQRTHAYVTAINQKVWGESIPRVSVTHQMPVKITGNGTTVTPTARSRSCQRTPGIGISTVKGTSNW